MAMKRKEPAKFTRNRHTHRISKLLRKVKRKCVLKRITESPAIVAPVGLKVDTRLPLLLSTRGARQPNNYQTQLIGDGSLLREKIAEQNP